MKKVKCTSCGEEFNENEIIEGLCKRCYAWELKYKEFEALSKPLIKYLNDNHHPHATIIIDTTHAELVEGIMVTETDEYIKD